MVHLHFKREGCQKPFGVIGAIQQATTFSGPAVDRWDDCPGVEAAVPARLECVHNIWKQCIEYVAISLP